MNWTSRKFWAAVGLTVLSAWLLTGDHLTGEGWTTFMMFIWGGYFVANAMDKRTPGA